MKVKLNLTVAEKKIFLKELIQHISEIENSLVVLEQEPTNPEIKESLFRNFHTIKGNAGIAEYSILQKFSHEIENTLQQYRNKPDPIHETVIDLLFQSIDVINALKDKIDNPKVDIDESQIYFMIDEFKNVPKPVNTTKQEEQKAVSVKKEESTDKPIALTITPKNAASLEIHIAKDTPMPAVRLFQILNTLNQKEIPYVSVPTIEEIQAEKIELPLIIHYDSSTVSTDDIESAITIIRQSDEVTGLKKINPLKAYPKKDANAITVKNITQNTKEELQDVQINIKKLDSLINLLGEILIDRNKIGQQIIELEEKYTLDKQFSELLDLVNHLGKITYNLQTELLNIRTIPLSNIIGKYPRLIRELGKKLGKKVRLEITGQHVELDRLILNYLNDMLIHLIRNAIDHGIEMPDDRKAQNKAETGTIRIESHQKNNKALFIISDDGKGIDPKIIGKSIIDKNIMDKETINSLSDDALIKYIFHPGFTTKQNISEISGRGVGMDVVQNTIQKLGGQITVESELGKGTKFKITLPLTLAIIHGLVNKSKDRTFIIPLSYVDEVLRCTGQQVQVVNNKPHIVIRDKLIPLICLKDLLYGSKTNIKKAIKLFIVIVNYNDKQTGIIVDRLVGEEEIVIKNIDLASDEFYIIHSATIMGTGEIGLILDIASLLDFVTMNKETQILKKESELIK